MEWEAEGVCGKNYYVAAPAPYDFDEYYCCMTESGMWETDGLRADLIMAIQYIKGAFL